MLNQNQWNKMHAENRFRPKYPEDDVVRWLFSNMSSNSKILDDGCGAGRHIMLLAENGYIPYGIDYSLNGVEYTRKLLTDNGYVDFAKNIQVSSCDKLPFSDSFFDGIISFGVFYYLEENSIKKAIDEAFRTLKSGGKMITVVRNQDDYRYKTYSNNENRIAVDDDKLSGNAENGMSEHFFTKSEIKDLFKSFSKLSIERIIRTHNNESICDNDFIVFAEK